VEALSTRYETVYPLHLLLDQDKARVKGKNNNPTSHIRTREGRWPTPANKTRHLSKLQPNLPLNHLETMGAESM